MRNEQKIANVAPAYVSRQTAAQMLDMSDDTFDRYVRDGTLPQPKRRGKLLRWKWSDIAGTLDGESMVVIGVGQDAFERGIELAKARSTRAA